MTNVDFDVISGPPPATPKSNSSAKTPEFGEPPAVATSAKPAGRSSSIRPGLNYLLASNRL